MIVTVTWLTLIGAGFVLDWLCRRSRRWPSLGVVLDAVVRRLPGRLAWVLIWGFVGWHVFARYTLPR